MNALEFVAFVMIFGGALYFAWRDGFEQGVSAGNRRHVRWWANTRGQLRRQGETLAGLDNRIDGIEARLAKLEQPDATVHYADGKPYAAFDDYKLRCEPEPDDICASCSRQGTSICYGCGFDHVFYDKSTEKPDDWDCDTCVNDGDMSHLQCRYCNEGSCYVKKEEPLKFDHEPSGEVVGTVVETEDTGRGMRFKIKPVDEYMSSDADPTDIFDNAVKVGEDQDADTNSD